MAYMALYRQWRPQNFDTLVGQQPVKTALTNALTTGRIAHAYLFAGPRGTGKTSTARILAKALNCEQGPTPQPCGHCSNCERIAGGTSMDVFEIDAASNRGIDEIKTLRDQLAFTPVDSRYKVYIIDEVHMLTTEAFNALLKTLEEPPAHVIFILATTDPHKIPATIHSRCQRFDFRRVTVDEIVEHLAMVAKGSGIEADEEALRLIAIQSEGGMRDALSLLDQCGVMSKHVTAATVREVLGIVGREALRALVGAIGRQQLGEALGKLNELLAQGKDVRQVLAELAEYLRAVLLFKTVPGYDEIYLTDTKDALEEIAPLFGRDRLMAAEERLHSAVQELRGTMRARITAELCLLDLCRIEGSTLAALSARVEQLEKQLAQGVCVQAVPPMAYVQTAASPARAAAPQYTSAPEPYDARGAAETSHEYTAGSVETKQQADSQQPAAPRPVQQARPAVQAQAPKPVASRPAAPQAAQPAMGGPAQQSAPAPAAASNAAAAPLEEYGGDWAAGEDFWKQAVQLLKDEKKIAMVSCANNGRVFSFDHDVLTLTFKTEFFCKRMNSADYRKAFEDALLRISRRSIRLQAVTEDEAKSRNAATAPRKQAKAVKQAEPAVPEVAADELPENLRKAMNAFGGTVTEA